MDLPVAGFRPFLSALSLTSNLPKPETMTSSPDSRDDFMISRRVSTVSCASEVDRSNFSINFSTIVILVHANGFALLLITMLKTHIVSVYLLILQMDCQGLKMFRQQAVNQTGIISEIIKGIVDRVGKIL